MKDLTGRDSKEFDTMLEKAFDKYAKDLADSEPACDMTEEDIRIMESQKDRIFNNIMEEIDKDTSVHKRKPFPTKLLVPLVAVFILAAAYSTNAFAFRTFLHKTFVSLTGTDLNLRIKKPLFDDYNSIAKFEKREKIIVPGWLPDGMQLERVTDGEDFLDLYYKEEVYWISLKTNPVSGGDITSIETENNDYKVREDKILGMDCHIVEITSETGIKSYMVHLNSDDLIYSMVTNVPEEDFEKILKNLEFLED